MTDSERKRWVVAVDGGGSKIAIAAQLCCDDAPLPNSLDSARLWTFAHCGSAHASVWSASQHHLTEALNVVCHALTLSEAGCPVRHTLFALAGAGREVDRAKVLDWARSLKTPFSCAPISCVSDIEPLIDFRHVRYSHNGLGSKKGDAAAPAADHAAAHKAHSGVEQQVTSVAVILGTGSIVATRNGNRELVRAGGWGPNLGDECSGGAFGIAALQRVSEWLDEGRSLDKPPPLVAAVLAALPDPDQWMRADRTVDRDRLSGVLIETAANRSLAATLAHVILEQAFDKKQPAALRLVNAHLERLSRRIEQVVHRAGLDPAGFELVFSGGLASNYAALREALVEACRARGLYPRESVVAEPLLAALRLALAEACQE